MGACVDAFAEVRDGGGVLARAVEAHAEQKCGARVVGSFGGRGFERSDGFGELLLLEEREAEVEAHAGKMRVELQRLAICGDGFGVAALEREHEAEVGVGLGVIRGRGEDRSPCLLGLGVLACLLERAGLLRVLREGKCGQKNQGDEESEQRLIGATAELHVTPKRKDNAGREASTPERRVLPKKKERSSRSCCVGVGQWRLEVELCAELEGTFAVGDRAGHLPEVSVGEPRVHAVELSVVEDVEALGAKLESRAFVRGQK